MRQGSSSVILLLFVASIPVTFKLSAQPSPDPWLLEEMAKIGVIDHHTHMTPASVDQGREEELSDLPGKPPFPFPVNLRVENPGWISAWRHLYGYRYDDLTSEHLGILLKEKWRTKREQGSNYPNWVLDKLGIDKALVVASELGMGQTPPRFYLVKPVDHLVMPFSENAFAKSGTQLGATLEDYVQDLVLPSLRSFKDEGALAVKSTLAYQRPLNFSKVSYSEAAPVYEGLVEQKDLSTADRRKLEDFLFRCVAQEAGKLGLAVHIHTGIGANPRFSITGSNPLLLEPTVDDPDLHNTRFVIIHGGWPYERAAGVMLIKPNVYADFSAQTFLRSPRALSRTLREWLEWYPEKVLFGSDAAPVSPILNWEEYAHLSIAGARMALAMALTDMMNDGEVTRERALELATRVLRSNAVELYKFE